MNAAKRVFVTGGNGFLGSRTVEALVQKGYKVRCLLRKTSDVSRIRHLSYEPHYGDILDPQSLASGASGCDYVVHLAGISSWDQIRKEASRLEQVIVGGTQNILESALQAGAVRSVIVLGVAERGLIEPFTSRF